jgi:hypothetical protein
VDVDVEVDVEGVAVGVLEDGAGQAGEPMPGWLFYSVSCRREAE